MYRVKLYLDDMPTGEDQSAVWLDVTAQPDWTPGTHNLPRLLLALATAFLIDPLLSNRAAWVTILSESKGLYVNLTDTKEFAGWTPLPFGNRTNVGNEVIQDVLKPFGE